MVRIQFDNDNDNLVQFNLLTLVLVTYGNIQLINKNKKGRKTKCKIATNKKSVVFKGAKASELATTMVKLLRIRH